MEAPATDIGARNFGATRFWHGVKPDFDERWLPDYLAPFRAVWRAANARARRCWIGDDGADGIAIGPGSSTGETFAEGVSRDWGDHAAFAVCSFWLACD
jgi:hypothetical protein